MKRRYMVHNVGTKFQDITFSDTLDDAVDIVMSRCDYICKILPSDAARMLQGRLIGYALPDGGCVVITDTTRLARPQRTAPRCTADTYLERLHSES